MVSEVGWVFLLALTLLKGFFFRFPIFQVTSKEDTQENKLGLCGFHSKYLNVLLRTFTNFVDWSALWKNFLKIKDLIMFLHCTSMYTTVDSTPQVLFAVHLYSPAWARLMLAMFNRFPLMCSPVVTFVHITVGSGIPAVTLQYTSTLSPSLTAIFSTSCSTDAGTVKEYQIYKITYTCSLHNSA